MKSPPEKNTVITKEYPQAYDGTNEPYYPINDAENQRIYNLYKSALPSQKGLLVGGRLGAYQYYDMHQIVAMAMNDARKLLV